MANTLAQYLADLQVQIKESETQLVFGVVISTSPLRVKYGEITLEDNFLFVEDGVTLSVGQEVPMLKTNRSQLFIVMLSKEFTPQEITPEDILSAIKTVDGSGSGLDADLLDGKHASDFSLDGHTQDWATITDKPTTATRWPAWSEVTGKPSTFAPATHSHAWSTITSRPANSQFPNTAEAIGASKNLNNYTTPGFYYQSANASASNGSNYPVARAGTLIVTKDAGTTQMYYEYNGSGVYYRTFYGSTWTAWQNLVAPKWANVSGKPSTFAPSSHTHTWAQVTGKPSTFAPSTHSHAWSTITSKPSTFAPSSHTHSRSQTTLRSATNISAGGNYSLSQAITNFDVIVVHYSTNYVNSTTYNADTFVLYPHGHPTSGTTPWSTYHAQTARWVTWQFTSTTNLKCVALGSTTSPRIRAVYGIKFTA